LFAAFLAADAALAVVACSTTSPEADGADATTETSSSSDAGKDAPVVKPEAGTEGGGGGNCSPANAACDIVLQNCPAQQECVVDNTSKTVCRPVESSQQLPKGRACCPSTSSNPCLPGLTCVGNDCVDGGAPTGRCSPACCKGDDQSCGKSDPEGISGACSLSLVDGKGNTLYDVCTYSQTCKPFKQQPCGADQICITEDKVGTSSCYDSNGKTNRQPCSFANECADGFICLGGADAGSCHYVCLLPGATHPFDASVEQGGPGLGGCPVGEKCELRIQNTPDWFAACSLDGG
jgi:hypothetical protein